MPKELELEISKLYIRGIKAEDWAESKEFRCGNGSMDNFLYMEAYEEHIYRHASTTLVFYEEELAAYFTLHRAPLKFQLGENEDEKVTQDALALARLAVSRKYQGKGLGTHILKEIIIRNAYIHNEIHIITDALYEKWKWYNEIGFVPLIEDEIDEENPSEVVFMALELLDGKLIVEFIDPY
ncbi:putative acetyltransferase [Desulfitobacterium dehalogenans ATCC 51507]|uniref:Putative acetyltransferase n=1 Tax=Desulfitobacterium dehalogenans (strain ATCC 51507 / DSM 9161 / JW/IU-DC1) TaxID=756499 RepID=I4ABU1_DESDJ|nr:GNAT family N-acetyltransferase [Desulfitobacterium dehalogenans]AFM01426.1 putative acetyltransferase [Desulfitobacterium dehalogenans ATCC 51507]